MRQSRDEGMRTALVIPVFDEVRAIGHVLAEVPASAADQVLLDDGGSTNGTPYAALAMGATVVRQHGRGYGRGRIPDLPGWGLQRPGGPDGAATGEVIARAACSDLRMCEVPMEYRVRIGESRVGSMLKGSVKAGYGILRAVIGVRLLRRDCLLSMRAVRNEHSGGDR